MSWRSYFLAQARSISSQKSHPGQSRASGVAGTPAIPHPPPCVAPFAWRLPLGHSGPSSEGLLRPRASRGASWALPSYPLSSRSLAQVSEG